MQHYNELLKLDSADWECLSWHEKTSVAAYLVDKIDSSHRKNYNKHIEEAKSHWWDAQRGAADLAQTLGFICSTCKGSCCKNMMGFLNLQQLVLSMLTISAGIDKDHSRHPIYLSKPMSVEKAEEKNKCCYQGSKGCIIPRLWRPSVCILYTCHRWEAFAKQMNIQALVTMSNKFVRNSVRRASEQFSQVQTDLGIHIPNHFMMVWHEKGGEHE